MIPGEISPGHDPIATLAVSASGLAGITRRREVRLRAAYWQFRMSCSEAVTPDSDSV